jgi:hypothetical protein
MRCVMLLITTMALSACSGQPPPNTLITCAHDAADIPAKGKGCGA